MNSTVLDQRETGHLSRHVRSVFRGFDSAADTITLRHTARSREGFARGALKAARFIAGRKGVYEFSDVLFGAAAEAG